MLWSDKGFHVRVEGPGMGRGGSQFDLPHPFVRIGRFEATDLQLNDTKVSRWHAYLHRFPEGIFFLDLGSRTGLGYSGERVSHGWVVPNEPILVGPYKLFVDTDREGAEFDPLARISREDDDLLQVSLSLTNHRAYTVVRPLTRVLTLLGSDRPSNLRISGASVFRSHVVFYRSREQVWAVNLIGSHVYRSNRRFIAAAVHDGDVCVIGGLVVSVSHTQYEQSSDSDDLRSQPADDIGSDLSATDSDSAIGIDTGFDSAVGLETLDSQVDSLEPGSSERDSDSEMATEIRRLNAEAHAMENLLHELENSKNGQIKKVESELHKVRSDFDAVEKELQQLRLRLEKANRDGKESKKSRQRVQELENSINRLNDERELQKEQLDADRSRMEASLAEQKREQTRLVRELESIRSDRDQIQGRLEQSKEDYEQQNKEAAAEIARLKQQLADAAQRETEQTTTLQAEREALKEERQRLDKGHARSTDELKEARELHRQLHEQLEQEGRRCERALADLEAATLQSHALGEESERNLQRAVDAESELKVLREQLTQAHHKVEKQLADCERVAVERDAALTDVNGLREKCDHLRSDLEQLRSRNSQLAAAEAQSAGRLAEKEEALARERSQHERIRQELETKVQSVADENRQLLASLAMTERDLNGQAREIDRLKGVLAKIAPRVARDTQGDPPSQTRSDDKRVDVPPAAPREVAPAPVARIGHALRGAPQGEPKSPGFVRPAGEQHDPHELARNIAKSELSREATEHQTWERPAIDKLDRRPHLDISEQLLHQAGRLEFHRRWFKTAIWMIIVFAIIVLIVLIWPHLATVGKNLFVT